MVFVRHAPSNSSPQSKARCLSSKYLAYMHETMWVTLFLESDLTKNTSDSHPLQRSICKHQHANLAPTMKLSAANSSRIILSRYCLHQTFQGRRSSTHSLEGSMLSNQFQWTLVLGKRKDFVKQASNGNLRPPYNQHKLKNNFCPNPQLLNWLELGRYSLPIML